MYFWIVVIASAAVFSLRMWYEIKHALDVDGDGNTIFKNGRTLLDEEHDEAVKAREAAKMPE